MQLFGIKSKCKNERKTFEEKLIYFDVFYVHVYVFEWALNK